jgi:hypothetical protein
LLNFGSINDGVDSDGTPFRLKDNPVLQDRIVLEVEADTEIVEVAAELEFVFTAFESVGVAEGEKLGLSDVVAGIGFEGSADTHPGFG